MKLFPRTGRLTKFLFAALILAPFAVARAQILGITYYTVAESDKDGGRMCCGVSDNYVQSTLGVDGLPVFNTGATATTGSVYTPDDLLGDGEITWWSPTLNNGGAGGTSDVVQTSVSTVSIPYNNNSFFAPNGGGTSGDGSAFQAAVISGTLDAPTSEAISFSISSDDMAFLYLNGTIACSDGGVHGATAVPCTSFVIPAGNNSLELFYVDLDPSQAVLDFSITTQDVTTSPPPPPTSGVPEPGTFTLLGSGLLGLAGFARRKFVHSA